VARILADAGVFRMQLGDFIVMFPLAVAVGVGMAYLVRSPRAAFLASTRRPARRQ